MDGGSRDALLVLPQSRISKHAPRIRRQAWYWVTISGNRVSLCTLPQVASSSMPNRSWKSPSALLLWLSSCLFERVCPQGMRWWGTGYARLCCINLQVRELDLHDLHFFRVNLDKLGPLQMHQCDLFPYSKGILADQGHIKWGYLNLHLL